MTNNKTHDLLVIGAGPVGCRVAAKVAGAGYDVAILEQKPSLDAPICCTALISDECLRRFDLPRDLIVGSLNAATVFSPKGAVISVRRDQIQAHVLDRPALDQQLYRDAATRGARGLFGAKVTALIPGDDGISAKVTQGGRTDDIHARAAVIAAGFGSDLLDSVGLRRATDWTMGVQAEVEVVGGVGVEIYVGRTYAPGFFAWLVPTSPGRAHVGLMSRRRAKANFTALIARLQNDGKIKGDAHPSFRGITLARPSRTYGARLVVTGDLAGQVKPITGGGLYFGLLCADIAARQMTAAFNKDNLSARALSAYEREWRALLGRELSRGRYARRAFGLLGNRHLEFLFGVARRYNLAERLARCDDIGFDWHGAALRQVVRLFSPFNTEEKA